MDNQQILIVLLLGISGGMMYGRWRAERLRAKVAMKNTWENKHTALPRKSWRLW